MACSDCRYYPLDMGEYPCSECKYGDMFVENNGNAADKDILTLICEVRQLKKAVLDIIEELKKNER